MRMTGASLIGRPSETELANFTTGMERDEEIILPTDPDSKGHKET